MKHISPKTHKQLMFLASKLPLVMVESHEEHYMTKKKLEEMGHVGAEKLGAKDGEENDLYIYKAPVQIAKNHYRCLRDALLKSGAKGCEDYINKMLALPNSE